jgi:hypothetical protein
MKDEANQVYIVQEYVENSEGLNALRFAGVFSTLEAARAACSDSGEIEACIIDHPEEESILNGPWEITLGYRGGVLRDGLWPRSCALIADAVPSPPTCEFWQPMPAIPGLTKPDIRSVRRATIRVWAETEAEAIEKAKAWRLEAIAAGTWKWAERKSP